MLERLRFRVEHSLGRRYPEPEHPYRNAFQRDRDRIIHARAFRRLEAKTQVFTPGLSDHFRNRLTHTIEVAQIARTLACEWGSHRINVNAIAPTVFRSDLTAWMYEEEGRGRDTREAMLARIPLGRLGEPEDFVGALLYFSSRASDFCTGQVLYVDGGYTAG